MRKILREIIYLSVLFFLFYSCSKNVGVHRLNIERGKQFEKLNFKKIWEVECSFLNACFPCPNGIVLVEVLDRSWSEFKLYLFDYSGNLKKGRILKSGQGPNEIQALGYATSWISSSGKIYFIDIGDYLKTINPDTLEIEAILKLSNVIKGYGHRYTLGRLSLTSLENKDHQIITSFESTAFPEDFNYYIIRCEGAFENLSIITKTNKTEPWTWAKLRDRDNYTDYYGVLRLDRIFSVDWKRNVVYYLPDIERPEIESVDFEGRRKQRFLIDINYEKFKVDRKELEAYHEYVLSEIDAIIKSRYNQILYIPPHAPALMGIKVIEDWLLVITGNRNWLTGENEVQVYKLPSLKYEGSFYIPFPNRLRTKWFGNYYVVMNLLTKDDDYYSSFEIYKFDVNS